MNVSLSCNLYKLSIPKPRDRPTFIISRTTGVFVFVLYKLAKTAVLEALSEARAYRVSNLSSWRRASEPVGDERAPPFGAPPTRPKAPGSGPVIVHCEYMALANKKDVALREATFLLFEPVHNSKSVDRRVCGHILKPC